MNMHGRVLHLWRRPARERAGVLLLATAAVLTLLTLRGLVVSGVGDIVRYSKIDVSQAEREVNGPLWNFAAQLRDNLSPDTCVELMHSDLARLRATHQEYFVFNAHVLSTVLHPRAVRLVADSAEAVAGAACDGRPRYVLVWLEDANPTARAILEQQLAELRATPGMGEVSTFADAGVAGYVFGNLPLRAGGGASS